MIQTYNTTLLYLFFSRPVFHPEYLRADRWDCDKTTYRTVALSVSEDVLLRSLGQVALSLGIFTAWRMVVAGGAGTYMGLIIIWAGPFLLLLWSLAYQLLINLPWSNTLLPIILPTLYLWVVDTLALKRGTWTIETGTKLGAHLWDGLDIEEAVFFLATNTLIVCGLVAFDNAVAVLNAFPEVFHTAPALPSPILLVKALLYPSSMYDVERLQSLTQAVDRLRRKSRSFYLASGAFVGRLRIDLVLLYSFCRMADDLVDNAASLEEAKKWITRLRGFLDVAYQHEDKSEVSLRVYVGSNFPEDARNALLHLPVAYLPPRPLYELLAGFDMDLKFSDPDAEGSESRFPIKTTGELDLYGVRVAGTVAELCIALTLHHDIGSVPPEVEARLLHSGNRVGVALQMVNIARDIAVDARMGRVYIPLTWLKEEQLTAEAVIRHPINDRLNRLRRKLLDTAFELYNEHKAAIEKLPAQARGPMRVAVESYMEIGRVLRQEGYKVKDGRATVPKWRRIIVAWNALNRW